MMHLYSALLCIAVYRKGFAIIGGGGGSPQPPPVQLPLDHLVEMKESFDRLIKKNRHHCAFRHDKAFKLLFFVHLLTCACTKLHFFLQSLVTHS